MSGYDAVYERCFRRLAVSDVMVACGDEVDPRFETSPCLVHRRAGELWFRDRLGPDDELRLKCPEMTGPVRDIFSAGS